MRIFISIAAASAVFVAAAPAAAQTHSLNIPAGHLGRSVVALGRQAKISISMTDPSLSRVSVQAVRGRMTANQALALLLTGTPARFVARGTSTYIVSRRPPPQARRLPAPSRPPPVMAAASPPEEIVITASKRWMKLGDYPGPVSIVGSSELPLSAALAGTDALTRHIAALGSTHLGPGRDKLFIRAIADSSFSGQTQATAGQYLGEARVNYNAPDPSLRLYDIGSIELLPGPQGTLYGAGTIGGVLRATPSPVVLDRKMTGFRASAAATAHGSGSGELAGMLNVPIVSGRAGVRMIGYVLSDGGYIDDEGRDKDDVNRTSIAGGRAAVRLQVTPETEVELTSAAQRISARDSQYAELAEGRLVRRSALAQPFRNSFALANVVVRSDFGAYRVLATGSLIRQSLSETFDATDAAYGPWAYQQRNRARLGAGEVRLSSDGVSSGTGWLAGISVVHNERQLNRAEGPPRQLVDRPSLRNTVDEHTLFGEVAYPVAPRLKLTAGARLTHVRSSGELEEDKQLNPEIALRSSADEWQFLPSLALGYDVSDQANAYARYQEGFRPGGVILVAGTTQRLASDHVAAWEGGLRFRSAVPVQVAGAVSASYIKWSDVQADVIDNTGFPSTANLGNGSVWSLDAQLQTRVARGLTVELSAVFSRSRVTNRNPGIIIIDGEPLPNVPRVSGRFGLDYRRQISPRGNLHLLGWGRYVGASQLGIGPNLGRKQGDYLDTGIEAQWRVGAVTTFLTVTNVFDRAGNRFALGSIPSFGSEEQSTPMRPRTVRIGISSGL